DPARFAGPFLLPANAWQKNAAVCDNSHASSASPTAPRLSSRAAPTLHSRDVAAPFRCEDQRIVAKRERPIANSTLDLPSETFAPMRAGETPGQNPQPDPVHAITSPAADVPSIHSATLPATPSRDPCRPSLRESLSVRPQSPRL